MFNPLKINDYGIKKIEKSDLVMFPRMQHRGLQFRHVERDAFKAELRHVEGHGEYWLVYQQSKPHVVAHVQLPKTEVEFDNILGWCLGQNHWCEYIEGDFSFLCVIAGFNAAELTPKYPDFISERVYALSDATRWWYEYGKETLLLKRCVKLCLIVNNLRNYSYLCKQRINR